MNEQRQQAYQELIDSLLECAQGETTQIVANNKELIDEYLIEKIQLLAADWDRQEKGAGFSLWNLAQYLYLTQHIKISQPTQTQFHFLFEVLKIIRDSGTQKQVYPLLQQNLDKLDSRLAQALRIYAANMRANLEIEDYKVIGYEIHNFSFLIAKLPLGNRANNIEIAIAGYQIILTIFTAINLPKDWATVQNNLGIAYSDRIKGIKANNLELSIAFYQNALSARKRVDFPEDWAETQINLSLAYTNRIKGDKANNIENAISYAENALLIFTEIHLPEKWAGTQNNLGLAYCERIKGDRADNLENAIACFQNSLRVRTQTNYPYDWAKTQNNLAIAYQDRLRGDKADDLENAIFCFQNVLCVYTEETLPEEWARSQNNLGNVYLGRIRGKKAENLEKAITCFKNALRIRTETDFPSEWADTQNNLAIAYNYRLEGERAENLEKAITCFKNALRIRTETDFPFEWAAVQNNLGFVYTKRIKGERAENLEEAITYLKNALRIRTETDFLSEWAETQNNLGVAYKNRIKGEKTNNREIAISYYQCALEIYSSQSNPVSCLTVANNLGYLSFQEENWQQAINAYITAIEAIEQSREWASNDYNKQEIISNAIYVYKNIVQACINIGQLDKALEFVERGKARNLVDLLATRDLYPKGNIPQQVIARLDDLRKKAIAEEKRLRLQSNSKGGLDTNTEDNRDITAPTASQNTTLDRTYLNSLRQQLGQLVTEDIKDIDPGFQLTQRVEPIDFEQIQATLPTEQTALIEWCIGYGTLSAFIVTSNQSTPLHLNYNKSQFSNLLETADRYYNSYRQRDGQWHQSLSNLLARLAHNLQIESIIEQIKLILPDCNQIILVPHRWLHLLPIHALPLADGRCLLDLFPNGVSYAPSVQLLELTQKQAEKNQEIKQEQNFFAVQNPTEDLKYTDIEVKTIRSQFTPNDEVLKTKEATKSALTKERLSKSNYTHFSCHGSFNFENPELSALLLADSKVEKVAIAEESRFLPDRDGSYIDLEQCLTLGEIFGLDLRNCSLVTLSACETGLTDFKSLSDEYIGLPSGFLFAGSPRVVSSLWAVDDLSTSFLVIKFYQNLQQMDSVPIALNQAQLWLRSLTRKEFIQWSKHLPLRGMQRAKFEAKFVKNEHPFASPYHWAAFCAVGS